MTREMNRPFYLTTDQIKQKAALYLLETGIATVGEVATLRGVSRQYLQKAAHDLEPRKKRKRFLKEVWRMTVDTFS